MSVARLVIRTVAVLAVAFGSLLVAPGVSSAATPNTAPAAEPAAVSPTAATGTNLRVCKYYGGTVRGCGTFYHYGEKLYSCDTRADGRTVTTQLYWSGAVRASLRDGNGSQAGCGYANLSITDGRAVYMRVCVSGLSCTSWYRATA